MCAETSKLNKLCIYAEEFFNAAEVIHVDYSTRYKNPVPNYLYCHSIELSLKSLLLNNKKNTISSLKKNYGHNISKLLFEFSKNEEVAIISEEERSLLNFISRFYLLKEFEYFDKGWFPHHDLFGATALKNIAKKLLDMCSRR
jgi:hypothetical protein